MALRNPLLADALQCRRLSLLLLEIHAALVLHLTLRINGPLHRLRPVFDRRRLTPRIKLERDVVAGFHFRGQRLDRVVRPLPSVRVRALVGHRLLAKTNLLKLPAWSWIVIVSVPVFASCAMSLTVPLRWPEFL